MSLGVRALLVGAVLPFLVGCDSGTGPTEASAQGLLDGCDGPARLLSVEQRSHIQSSSGAFRDADQMLDDQTRDIPGGFAGYFLDDGRAVVLLRDPSRAAEALSLLDRRLPGQGLARASVRPARWTFAQLFDWYRYLLQDETIGAIAGLSTTDLDEVQNRIVIGLVDEPRRQDAARRLAALNLPCELVRLEVTGIITPWR